MIWNDILFLINSFPNLLNQLTANDICMVVVSGCYELIPHTDNVPPPDNFIQIHLTLQHTLANTTCSTPPTLHHTSLLGSLINCIKTTPGNHNFFTHDRVNQQGNLDGSNNSYYLRQMPQLIMFNDKMLIQQLSSCVSWMLLLVTFPIVNIWCPP